MFGKSFKELLHDRKGYDNILCSQDRYICPVCGGDGEVINENHALADSDFERRYVICGNCHGIGSIPIGDYHIGVRRVLKKLFNNKEVLAYVTETESGSRRLFSAPFFQNRCSFSVHGRKKNF